MIHFEWSGVREIVGKTRPRCVPCPAPRTERAWRDRISASMTNLSRIVKKRAGPPRPLTVPVQIEFARTRAPGAAPSLFHAVAESRGRTLSRLRRRKSAPLPLNYSGRKLSVGAHTRADFVRHAIELAASAFRLISSASTSFFSTPGTQQNRAAVNLSEHEGKQRREITVAGSTCRSRQVSVIGPEEDDARQIGPDTRVNSRGPGERIERASAERRPLTVARQ